MKMNAEDRRRFPRLYQYLRYSLPTLASTDAMVSELPGCALLSRDDLEQALIWGALPQVRVVDLVASPASLLSETEIKFDQCQVRDFESDTQHESGLSNHSHQQGVTFLQELCDWAHCRPGSCAAE